MSAARGDLALFLHNHLPFVRHPEHEYFLEEHWLFEAVTECYLPLLMGLFRLTADGVPWKLSCSLTAPLATMLEDPLLRGKYQLFLDRTLELAEKEIHRTRNEPAFQGLAVFYRDRLRAVGSFLEDELGGRVLNGFRSLADTGSLDIACCAATHGLLPMLAAHPPSVEAQVAVGVAEHRRLLGREPAGMMLPECAYFEGLEDTLARHRIRFFLTESHGILNADPPPRCGVFAPLFCPNGVAAFGRDQESGQQVWSATQGYPGDHHYRDFYRDVGYDREFDYIRPYVSPDGLRAFTGLKYHRITGDTAHKEPYDPRKARELAETHAANFVFNRERQVEHLAAILGRRPLLVAPYDGELFGHWWFEGPDFLFALFRRLAQPGVLVRPVTLRGRLEEECSGQRGVPNPSSWGDKGYFEVWCNGGNDWLWRHIHQAGRTMTRRAREHHGAGGTTARVLAQMARELLLLQASDWPFLITMGTSAEYARRRLDEHFDRFRMLEAMLEGEIPAGGEGEQLLAEIEELDNIFPTIDFRVFC